MRTGHMQNAEGALLACMLGYRAGLPARSAPGPGQLHLKLSRCMRTVLHTSASLTINENASPDVRVDLNVSAVIWRGMEAPS